MLGIRLTLPLQHRRPIIANNIGVIMSPGLRGKDIASRSGGSNNARYGRPTQGRSLTSGGEVKPGFNFLKKNNLKLPERPLDASL